METEKEKNKEIILGRGHPRWEIPSKIEKKQNSSNTIKEEITFNSQECKNKCGITAGTLVIQNGILVKLIGVTKTNDVWIQREDQGGISSYGKVKDIDKFINSSSLVNGDLNEWFPIRKNWLNPHAIKKTIPLPPDYYDDTELVDFKIHCENGSAFVFFHKLVLSNSSDYFKSLLSGRMKTLKEGTDGVLELPNASLDLIQGVKYYIYHSELRKEEKDLIGLFELSHELQLWNLFVDCCKRIDEKICILDTIENEENDIHDFFETSDDKIKKVKEIPNTFNANEIMEILNMAHLYDVEHLFQRCIRSPLLTCEIIESPAFKIELLSTIMSMRSEEEIYSICKKLLDCKKIIKPISPPLLFYDFDIDFLKQIQSLGIFDEKEFQNIIVRKRRQIILSGLYSMEMSEMKEILLSMDINFQDEFFKKSRLLQESKKIAT